MTKQFITAKTNVVGLVAWPIGHSLSPVMHNAAFQDLALDWVYLPLPVHPANLKDALAGLPALGFLGCNISVPHKIAAAQFVHELSPTARVIGAINTIQVKDNKKVGTNTDPEGFVNALYDAGCDPQDMRVLMLGAGGAARSAVYGLSQIKGTTVLVFDVLQEQAQSLVSDLEHLFAPDGLLSQPLNVKNLSAAAKNADLIVNASPVGMAPQSDASPWPEHIALPDGCTCFDMVYNPYETRFLSQARAAGLRAISGLGMLVNQGALSFELWTEKAAPKDVMYQACLAAIGS
jgi:shikimate dehydrogenase